MIAEIERDIGGPQGTPIRSRLISDVVLRRLAYYPRAALAVRYAFDRIPEPVYLHEIARAAGMNPSAFSRYFAEKIGVSFFCILRMLRVERALQTLEKSDSSLVLLAERAGYKNACTFARAFKSVLGETPSQYRRRFLVLP